MKNKRFEKATIVVVVISLLMAGPVLARLSVNTIDPTVIMSSNNRQVLVTGPIACTQGEKLSLDVMVTQRTTGAITKGVFQTICTGEIQRWEINTKTQGVVTLEEGTAVAWALATTRNDGVITDATQWSREVTVVK
jgi:hypothetical protein